jgi:hypothetical protein
MFGFLSGPLTLHDRQVSDCPNNDCGEVTGRLLNARDAGHVLIGTTSLTCSPFDLLLTVQVSTLLFPTPKEHKLCFPPHQVLHVRLLDSQCSSSSPCHDCNTGCTLSACPATRSSTGTPSPCPNTRTPPGIQLPSAPPSSSSTGPISCSSPCCSPAPIFDPTAVPFCTPIGTSHPYTHSIHSPFFITMTKRLFMIMAMVIVKC